MGNFFSCKRSLTDSIHIAVKIPSPPDDSQLDAQFKALLDERELALEVQEKKLQFELSHEKWFYVYLNKLYHHRKEEGIIEYWNPVEFVDELLSMQNGSGFILHFLRCINENIAMYSWYWLQEFMDAGGVECLLTILPDTYSMPKATKDIAVLKVFMGIANYNIGIDQMISVPGFSLRVLLCFDTPSIELKTRTMNLLEIVMCHSLKGKQQVFDSFLGYKVLKNEKLRFECIVECLKSNRYDMELKTRALGFINTLLGSAFTLEDRVAMRYDMLHQNILDFLDIYSSLSNKLCPLPELEKQIELFHQQYQADKLETMVDNVDLSNAAAVFDALQKSTTPTDEHHLLLETLQHLLILPCDGKLGKEIWQVLHQTLAQIITLYTPSNDVSSENYDFKEIKTLLNLRNKITNSLEDDLDGNNTSQEKNDPVLISFETPSTSTTSLTLEKPLLSSLQESSSASFLVDDSPLILVEETTSSFSSSSSSPSPPLVDDSPLILVEETTSSFSSSSSSPSPPLVDDSPLVVSPLISLEETSSPLISLENSSSSSQISFEEIPSSLELLELAPLLMESPMAVQEQASISCHPSPMIEQQQAPVQLSSILEKSETVPKTVQDHERYSKFFRMLAMNMPREQVKRNMVLAHLDPDLLDSPNAPICVATNTPSSPCLSRELKKRTTVPNETKTVVELKKRSTLPLDSTTSKQEGAPRSPISLRTMASTHF